VVSTAAAVAAPMVAGSAAVSTAVLAVAVSVQPLSEAAVSAHPLSEAAVSAHPLSDVEASAHPLSEVEVSAQPPLGAADFAGEPSQPMVFAAAVSTTGFTTTGTDSYSEDGGCYVVQRRMHTRYGWRMRPVQVCG
jgi:hypothetical protein